MKGQKKPTVEQEPLFEPEVDEKGQTRGSLEKLTRNRLCGWCGKVHEGLTCPR